MHEYGECKIIDDNNRLCKYCEKHPEEETLITVKGYYDGKYFHITKRLAKEIIRRLKEGWKSEKIYYRLLKSNKQS